MLFGIIHWSSCAWKKCMMRTVPNGSSSAWNMFHSIFTQIGANFDESHIDVWLLLFLNLCFYFLVVRYLWSFFFLYILGCYCFLGVWIFSLKLSTRERLNAFCKMSNCSFTIITQFSLTLSELVLCPQRAALLVSLSVSVRLQMLTSEKRDFARLQTPASSLILSVGL